MGLITPALPFSIALFSVTYLSFWRNSHSLDTAWVVLAIFWSLVAKRFNALIGALESFQKSISP